MKNKILLLFVITILVGTFVGSAYADGEELFFEPNKTIDIKAYCFDSNKSFCASGTSCYISLFYPNTTVFVDNATMSVTGSYYNYTRNGTTKLGVYRAMINCVSGSTAFGYKDFKFYIGRPSTYVQGKTTNQAIYILFGISILLFVGFLFIEKAPFKWSFFLFSLLFLVMAINVVSITLRNEAGNENIRNIFDTLGSICYYMYWFIGGLFLMIWVLTTLASLAERKNMQQAERIGSIENNPY